MCVRKRVAGLSSIDVAVRYLVPGKEGGPPRDKNLQVRGRRVEAKVGSFVIWLLGYKTIFSLFSPFDLARKGIPMYTAGQTKEKTSS